MAKKKAQTAQTVVRIGTTTPDKKLLSKAQKEFNRLTRKITALEKEIVSLRQTAEKVQVRVQTELRPLLLEHAEQRANIVRLLDNMHGTKGLTKIQRAKIGQIIREITFDLIDLVGHDDLKPIYDKYDERGFDATNEEAEAATLEQMKEMVTAMFGIQFDADADVDTPEKMKAYVDAQMDARQEAFEKEHQADNERRASRPKTAKEQEREAKQQAEATNISKAVRTLYMDLVKAFHPDREPDEAEKIRKTEVMQRITAAHEAGDLLALLKLQLEFDRIDQEHLENLADEQLTYYNKILLNQVNTLTEEKYEEEERLESMSGGSFFVSGYHVEFQLSQRIAEIRRQIKQLQSDLTTLADVTVLKAWLRSYRLDKD